MVERRRYNFYSTRRFPFSKAPRAVVPSAPVALRAVGRGVLAPLVCHSHRPCVSVPRKRESSCFFLDCCLRRKDTVPPHPASLDGWPPSPARGEADWVPAYARRTLGPSHPAVPWAPPASPAVGRGVLDCCLRRKDTCSCLRRDDTVAPAAGPAFGVASGQAGLSRQGRGGLDSRLRGNDISPPQTANVPLPSGRGSIPLTWLSQRLSRPLPGWGEAGKKKPRDSPSA